MKVLFCLVLAFTGTTAFGAAGDIRFMQKDPTNLSFLARDLPLPGANSVYGFNNSTQLPVYFKLGSTLSYNSGTGLIDVSTITAGSVSGLATIAQTGSATDALNWPQSDWNQSNSSAQDFIKNKPSMVTGPTGPTGPQGPQGTAGSAGAVGPTGPAGSAGSNGSNGADGATGPTGAEGPQGFQGPVGPTGAQGPDGINGSNGSNGINGATGPTGMTGATGAKGDPGVKGDPGNPGTDGANGSTGPQGPAGTNGANGTNGTNGVTGPTGPSGVVSATSPLAYNSGTQTVSIQTSSGSQAGALSSSNWTTFNNKFGTVTYTPSTPSRSLNSNFTPSSSNAVMACYSIKISCSVSLGGSCEGNVELRSDANTTPTAVRAQTSMSLGGTLVVGLALSNNQTVPVCYLVPPSHNVRLVSTTVSGSPSFSIISQSEVSEAFSQ